MQNSKVLVLVLTMLCQSFGSPMLHILMPPWNATDETFRSKSGGMNGVEWLPGPNILSYGTDPATSVHSMLEGIDMVKSEDDHGNHYIRFNFTNNLRTLQHRHTVLSQTLEYKLGRQDPSGLKQGKDALEQLLGFKDKGYQPMKPLNSQVQLLVPTYVKNGNSSSIGEYMTRQIFPMHVKNLLPEGKDDEDAALKVSPISDITFYKDEPYIVDMSNNRVLKVRPGGESEIFFGGKGSGSGLDQLDYPQAITFYQEEAYIVDKYNNRILKVRAGEERGEIFFGGKGYGNGLDQLKWPEAITFYQEEAYIVDKFNNRILKVRPGEERGEIFFGGKGYGNGLDQLHTPEAITFYQDEAYIVDKFNNRILKVRPGEERGEIFFGGKGYGNGLDQLKSPEAITFYQDGAYIVDNDNHRVLKVRPGEETGEIFFGGQGKGSGLDQLKHSEAITFYQEEAYIVDTSNHRVLKVRPGEERGEIFFGGKGYGNGLDQLHFPKAITFYKEEAYIVDKGNHRVLKVRPGEERGEIFFGGKGRGSGLDQLNFPEAITFYQEEAYIVDKENHRVLKVRPGEERGEIFFGGKGKGSGLDQLNSPKAITFYKGHAYIVDKENHRVLKVRPGEERGEIFFGGNGYGSGLDQLDSPQAITFYKENAYIVDNFNHRVLKVRPGEKRGEIFFGGKGKGSGLDQLNSPEAITFYKENAYIVDNFNRRVLKVRPGEERGEIFFGGKGYGSGLDQLKYPQAITFYKDKAYIVDTANNRVLVVDLPEKQVLQFCQTIRVSKLLSSCRSVREASHEGSTIFLAECQGLALPGSTLAMDRLLPPTLGLATYQWKSNSVELEVRDQAVHLPAGTQMHLGSLPDVGRTEYFKLWLVAIAVLSMSSYATGHCAAHGVFLLVAAMLFILAVVYGACMVPFGDVGSFGMPEVMVILGLFLPWLPVPLFLLFSFDALREDAFTSTKPLAVTCATGIGWEYHIFTAFVVAISASLWALCLGDQVTEGPLFQVPKFLRRCTPPAMVNLLEKLENPPPTLKRPLKRLQQLLSWVQGSMGDQYLDLCSYFVLRSCGYSLANYSLIAIGVAIVFQNFGGALHLLFSSSTLTLPFAKKCFYACMSVAMAPPFKLIDRELEATRMYMVLARLLFEDAPQLLLQAHFTIVVYRNWFVMLNLGLSVVFALLDAKDVYLHHCKSPLEQHHYVDAEMAALRASTELEVHEGEMMKRQKEPSGINSKLVD